MLFRSVSQSRYELHSGGITYRKVSNKWYRVSVVGDNNDIILKFKIKSALGKTISVSTRTYQEAQSVIDDIFGKGKYVVSACQYMVAKMEFNKERFTDSKAVKKYLDDLGYTRTEYDIVEEVNLFSANSRVFNSNDKNIVMIEGNVS